MIIQCSFDSMPVEDDIIALLCGEFGGITRAIMLEAMSDSSPTIESVNEAGGNAAIILVPEGSDFQEGLTLGQAVQTTSANEVLGAVVNNLFCASVLESISGDAAQE